MNIALAYATHGHHSGLVSFMGHAVARALTYLLVYRIFGRLPLWVIAGALVVVLFLLHRYSRARARR